MPEDFSTEKSFINQEKLKQEFNEYKNFAYRKNFFVMALALVLATQTQKFASSITESFLMPIINFLLSKTNGNWRHLVFTPVTGMDIEVGNLLNSFIEFTIITIILYLVFQKVIRRIDPDAEIEMPHIGHMKKTN